MWKLVHVYNETYIWWFLQVLIESIICMYMYRYLFILLCLVWYCFNPKMAKVFHLENLLVFMKQTEKLIQTPNIMVVPEDIYSSCIVLIFLLFHYLILSLMWLLALYLSFSHSINTLFSGILNQSPFPLSVETAYVCNVLLLFRMMKQHECKHSIA